MLGLTHEVLNSVGRDDEQQRGREFQLESPVNACQDKKYIFVQVFSSTFSLSFAQTGTPVAQTYATVHIRFCMPLYT